VEAENSTPTLAEVWKREQRIEKALTILAPKVDAIMKALEEGKKRAEKMAAQSQSLPPVPNQTKKGRFQIDPGILDRIVDVAEKAFTEPTQQSSYSAIEQKLMKKAIDDVFVTIDNDRAIGSAVRKHIEKHGLKGIIKFGEAE